MKAIRETEKAVLVKMICDEFENSNRHEVEVWLPKSQIHNGFAGTTVSNWIAGKKEEEYFKNIKHDYIKFYDANGNDIEIEEPETAESRKASDDFVRGMIRIQRMERYASSRRKAA